MPQDTPPAATRTAPEPAPIRRGKLYEQVVERIVAAIAAGEYPPGTLLPSEDDLRMRYGVGRLAVREALLSLERMGATAFVPGVGLRVVVPTPSQIVDKLDPAMLLHLAFTEGSHAHLREMRLALETALVGLAVDRATDADLQTIADALEREKACIDDRSRYLVADRDFHLAVAAAAHNPIFAAQQAAARRWIESSPSTKVHVPGSDAISHADHTRVFDALARRDRTAAVAAMTRHLTVDYSLTGKLSRLGRGG